MNYKKHYDNLIIKAQTRNLDKSIYVERHHIIPKCMNGSDDPNNIVKLLPEEHIIAHLLLYKIYQRTKLIYAIVCMLNGFNQCKIKNNKEYGYFRRKFNPAMCYGIKKGKDHPMYGKKHSDESRKKISDNHHNVAGKNNPKAKTWKIISPTNEVFIITGELKKFCKEHNLSYNKMLTFRNIGKIQIATKNSWNITELSNNCNNWEICEI